MAEEIDFENHHFWNFKSHVTLTMTLDDLESHIVVNVSSTLTNSTIWFVAALRLIVDVRTDVRTYGRTDIFSGFIMSSRRRWPKDGRIDQIPLAATTYVINNTQRKEIPETQHDRFNCWQHCIIKLLWKNETTCTFPWVMRSINYSQIMTTTVHATRVYVSHPSVTNTRYRMFRPDSLKHQCTQ